VLGVAGFEAWRIPIDSWIPAREAPAPWCLVVPAPRGGWRYAVPCGENKAFVFAPGEELDPAGPRVLEIHREAIAWDASGASLVHHDGAALRRYVVATGEDIKLFDQTPWLWGVTASPDGQTLYTTVLVAHVRRQLITNFADRPWASGNHVKPKRTDSGE
jgi:hypothetical protein